MSDIFISYASDDRPQAQRLAQALEDRGWSTFWDRTIPIGMTWREVIGKELDEARCVVVLWSKASSESTWVQEEAEDGQRRGILIPVLIEGILPPIGFRSLQSADLSDWDGTQAAPIFQRLVSDITRLLRPSPKAEAEEQQKAEEEEHKQAAAEAKRKADAEEQKQAAAK